MTCVPFVSSTHFIGEICSYVIMHAYRSRINGAFHREMRRAPMLLLLLSFFLLVEKILEIEKKKSKGLSGTRKEFGTSFVWVRCDPRLTSRCTRQLVFPSTASGPLLLSHYCMLVVNLLRMLRDINASWILVLSKFT